MRQAVRVCREQHVRSQQQVNACAPAPGANRAGPGGKDERSFSITRRARRIASSLILRYDGRVPSTDWRRGGRRVGVAYRGPDGWPRTVRARYRRRAQQLRVTNVASCAHRGRRIGGVRDTQYVLLSRRASAPDRRVFVITAGCRYGRARSEGRRRSGRAQRISTRCSNAANPVTNVIRTPVRGHVYGRGGGGRRRRRRWR